MSKNTLQKFKNKFKFDDLQEMSLSEYIEECKTNKDLYLNPHERLLKAIGEPDLVDTKKDPRLGRIYGNKVIRKYKTFNKFFGLEDVIDNIVSFIKYGSQGLEEKKQVLYLRGPVGGGKSSLAEHLKFLMEKVPFYALKDSPVFDNPLCFFNPNDSDELNISPYYLNNKPSPWALKRLKEFEGDISKFKVVKLFPSQLYRVAISKTEPADENNQDISSLVGKVNIREITNHDISDPDCYSFSGGLCRGNRGIMEFVEMFKAPLPTLLPLLGATQEGSYNGTEALSGIPFEGIILAHSNETEWAQFKNNPKNEAFLDRIYTIPVPYVLRVTDERKIYEKLLRESALHSSPCAPETLNILASMTVLSRLVEPKNSSIEVKLKVYDGEAVKDKFPDAKSITEYQNTLVESGITSEGFEGLSTRLAFKILSKTYNADVDEIAADPVHLLAILRRQIIQEQFPKDTQTRYLNNLNYLKQEYLIFLDREIKKAYIEAYDEFGQNMFDKYVIYAENWLEDNDYRDPDTGLMFDSEKLEKYLKEIEDASKISNVKDFRSEIVRFCLKHQSVNGGKNPKWTSYTPIRSVIENKIFTNTADLLPIISFSAKSSEKEKKKHKAFVERMKSNGYTEKQIKVITDFFLQESKS